MSEVEVIKAVKVYCPRCGEEAVFSITPSFIKEVEANPLGLAGLAFPHADHVLVVYFDKNGNERGTRVFSLLQAPVGGLHEISLLREDVGALRNISGFVIESRKLGLRLKFVTEASFSSLKATVKDTSVELDLRRDISYREARAWLEMFTETLDASFSTSPLDYVNAIRILDVLMEEKLFSYARQIFWLVANASSITIRTKLPESQLLKKYRPTILFERYNGNFVTRIVDSNGLKVSEVLGIENPQVLFSYAEALLSLYRRGVIDLVVE